jgi:hypothetical protein
MEFFNPNANIPFMSWRISVGISAFLILARRVLVTRGLDQRSTSPAARWSSRVPSKR